MKRRKLAVCGVATFVCVAVSALPTRTQALPLDEDGDMKLGVRTYVNARVGTEETNQTIRQMPQPGGTVLTTYQSLTFPRSEAGHLRQNRFFVEVRLDHDLDRLVKKGFGPFELLNDLPFKIRGFKYHLTFRGEGDGLYDWGPREYSTSSQYRTGPGSMPGVNLPNNPVPLGKPVCPAGVTPDGTTCERAVDVYNERHTLRNDGSNRERLFQAYTEGEVGDLFVRFGRQILAWGETDGFRLLDQINPTDSSFGGFLISLDERRVPLDMLRADYRIGDFGPVSEMTLGTFAAIDDRVGWDPGTPSGSPWTLPNLGAPSATTLTILATPHRTFTDIRGGGRLYWNMFDATFTLAHYYTYFDTPALQIFVPCGTGRCGSAGRPFTFPLSTFSNGYSATAYETAPQVQVSGASTTFAIDKLYSVVRSEFAYFNGEPRFRQSAIDPFVFAQTPGLGQMAVDPVTKAAALTGGRGQGNSINYVLGLDVNRYIRFLNPYQTFFFSTQVFYKRLLDPAPSGGKFGAAPLVTEGEVLPVPAADVGTPIAALGAVEPKFVRQSTDQILQTLFIGTSYRSGTVNPSATLFYDWSGSIVYAPSVTFLRDPWRFTLEMDILDAGSLKGNSGVSLLRDRDNVLFQLEYAI